MRIITQDIIFSALSEVLRSINTNLGSDVLAALSKAKATAENAGALVLDDIVANAELAANCSLPLCQDTGMVVVFAKVGIEVKLEEPLQQTINRCVAEVYPASGYRPSIVSDPLARVNTGNNTPALVYVELIPGSGIELDVMVKGFGSENMSRLTMLTPAGGYFGVRDFVVETVRRAGGNPCPPIIVGVGVGGTFEYCAMLAKRALLRPIGESHSEAVWAQREEELLGLINALGIGPGGAGGGVTALSVQIEYAPTHIAALPVAVNILCHSSRHKKVVL